MKRKLCILIIFFNPIFGRACDTTKSQLSKEVASLNEKVQEFIKKQNYTLKIGLSVALRSALSTRNETQARAIATITPFDKIVSIDHNDKLAVIISTTLAAYPFENTNLQTWKWAKALGFCVNVNLAEFANNQTETVFNKPVDGGLGFSYLLSEHFALAITFERISVRQPTEFLFKNEGKQIKDENGGIITSLNIKDERFFHDTGMNGMSVKFIFHFN